MFRRTAIKNRRASPSTLALRIRRRRNAYFMPWQKTERLQCRSRKHSGPFGLVCWWTNSASPGWSTAKKLRRRERAMSKARVLVGTRKGAFILTSDGKRENWEVSGPHFAGWELYHLKGSPADPNRIYASQSSGWFGQILQRSNDGGQTWEAVGNK